MRLLFSPITAACTLTAALLLASLPAHAQDFDPRQAVIDGLTLDAAVPLIEGAYGPIDEDRLMGDNFRQPGPDDSPARMLIVEQPSGRPVIFLFCHERMAAYTAPVSHAVAAAIAQGVADDVGGRESAPQNVTAMVLPDGVTIMLADLETTLFYDAAGAVPLRALATYPDTTFRTYDFYRRCVEGAG